MCQAHAPSCYNYPMRQTQHECPLAIETIKPKEGEMIEEPILRGLLGFTKAQASRRHEAASQHLEKFEGLCQEADLPD